MRQMQRTTNGWLPEIFNDFFDNEWMPRTKATAPAINVMESDSAYTVEVAAPGMCKQDFNIQINDNGDLVIKMEKKVQEEEEKKDQQANTPRYLRREFAYSKFQQTLILPDDVEKIDIKAKVENGVLTITLPKVVVKDEPKVCTQIEIA